MLLAGKCNGHFCKDSHRARDGKAAVASRPDSQRPWDCNDRRALVISTRGGQEVETFIVDIRVILALVWIGSIRYIGLDRITSDGGFYSTADRHGDGCRSRSRRFTTAPGEPGGARRGRRGAHRLRAARAERPAALPGAAGATGPVTKPCSACGWGSRPATCSAIQSVR